MMRYVEITQTATNGTTNAAVALPTPDDNNYRMLRRLWILPAAASGLVITLRRAGFQLAVIDSLRCAAGNHPIVINEIFPPTIQFTIDFANNSGGTVTNIPILASYEVGQGPITIDPT